MVPRPRKSEVTRTALMDAALTVFQDKGFENTQIKDIVRCAAKSVGVFYRYFESKAALLNALLDDFNDEHHWYIGAESSLLVMTQRKFVMRTFWESYIRHGILLRSLHQAASSDQHFQNRLNDLRANGLRAVTCAIRANWPATPRASLQPEFVAEMVTKVMEHSAEYWSFNAKKLQKAGFTEGDAFDTLVRLVDVMMLPSTDSAFDTIMVQVDAATRKRASGKT